VNIFAVNRDPVLAAKDLIDGHVGKMCLESAQILCTAHRTCKSPLSSSKLSRLYKATHVSHPSSKWVCYSRDNYSWLYEHFEALSAEYQRRSAHKNPHASFAKLGALLRPCQLDFYDDGFVPWFPAMPEEMKPASGCSVDEMVTAYKHFYVETKQPFAYWTERAVPTWYREACEAKGLCEYEGKHKDGRRYRFMHTE
jgi:hypothetical protein